LNILDTVLTEYYPGSKMKREVNHVKPETEDTEIDWPKGRILTIQGFEVECFTTGQLASLLGGRSAVTIRTWESEGILPKSGYSLPGKGGDVRGRRRYYTRAQVKGLIDIAREEGVLLPGPRIFVNRTKFTDRALEYFKDLRKRGIR
jgi:hypothetical protein